MTEGERDEPGAGSVPESVVSAESEESARAGADDERPLTEEERAALLREQLKALRVADVAHDMMLSLVTLGYQKLGLTDETRELRNLEDARLAIELLRGVIDVLGAVTGEQLVAPFRSTLAAMQMNFARVAAPPAGANEAGRIGDENGDEPVAAQDAGAGEPEPSGQGV
jgi:hypothetical protein